jgi:hypothetical protein
VKGVEQGGVGRADVSGKRSTIGPWCTLSVARTSASRTQSVDASTTTRTGSRGDKQPHGLGGAARPEVDRRREHLRVRGNADGAMRERTLPLCDDDPPACGEQCPRSMPSLGSRGAVTSPGEPPLHQVASSPRSSESGMATTSDETLLVAPVPPRVPPSAPRRDDEAHATALGEAFAPAPTRPPASPRRSSRASEAAPGPPERR